MSKTDAEIVRPGMPAGCNLRDQTEEEQLIGEKYLRRWGILADDALSPKF